MSKYGKIVVNLSQYYTSEQLNNVATKLGISYDKAESLARNIVYRKLYQKVRNQDPTIKAKRRNENKLRAKLVKAFRVSVSK